MKKLLATIFLVLFMVPVTTAPLAAAAVGNISDVCHNADSTQVSDTCKNPANQSPDPNAPNPIFGPGGILTTLINILSLAVGVISVFVILIAGIKFITSSGEPQSVNSARNTILYAVIALVITMSAQLAVRLILSRLPN